MRTRVLALLALLLTLLVALGAQADDYGRPTVSAPAGKQPNFLDLQNLLTRGRPKTVEDALPALTARYPEYFKFQTLMYNSFSLQQSSFREPRAIIFGWDARFVLTFNGGPAQAGGTALETMEYSASEHAFKFREIAFKYPGFKRSDLGLAANEIAFENDAMVISQPNPQKCLACHGDNANPIWSAYFLWPGAYGSDDDGLSSFFDRSSWNANNFDLFSAATKPMSQGRLMELKPGVPDRELLGMISYVRGKPAHPRYRWLPPTFIEPSIARYMQGQPLAQLDGSDRAQAEHRRNPIDYWPSRPNLVFLDDLIALNQDRLIADLKRAGLNQGSLAALPWEKLEGSYDYPDSPRAMTIATALLHVEQVLDKYPFKGPRPMHADLYKKLVSELQDEIGMQQEKASNQQATFGPNSLRYNGVGEPDYRLGLEWLGNPEIFYRQFLSLWSPTNPDIIAFHIETSDLLLDFTLETILADRGMDLHRYILNHRQSGLSFAEGGLDQVYSYLGMKTIR